MYCKLCGLHLYKNLSFITLFKWQYNMHPECEKSLHNVSNYMTFPIEHTMVDYTYIFEQGYQESDTLYVFEQYYRSILELYLEKREWSVIIDLDDIIDNSDLRLIIPLADSKVLMVSMFYEQLLRNDEK